MEEEIADCPLCGRTEYKTVNDKTEREKQGLLRSKVIKKDGKIYNGNVVMCQCCGLIYTNPRLTEKAMEEYYKTEYRKVYTSCEESHIHHANNACNIIKKAIDKGVIKTTSTLVGTALLDIGCNQGHLLEKMKSFFDRVKGIEPGYDSAKICTEKGINVFNGILKDYPAKFEFDVITCINTLEHFHNPVKELERMRELLTEDGVVVITVPYVYSQMTPLPADAFLSNAHLFHFGVITLRQTMYRAGLKPVSTMLSVENMGEKITIIAKKCVPENKLETLHNMGKLTELTRMFFLEWNFKWIYGELVKN